MRTRRATANPSWRWGCSRADRIVNQEGLEEVAELALASAGRETKKQGPRLDVEALRRIRLSCRCFLVLAQARGPWFLLLPG